jgi:tRNA U34 5-methylaminomethyl-2-thiouridine-forming methyltransferase MnmC
VKDQNVKLGRSPQLIEECAKANPHVSTRSTRQRTKRKFYRLMEQKIITTSDGSHSIYIPELDEHYHSIHGAIQESKHVFIEAGLKKTVSSLIGSELSILEIGFGTGLNALLTFMEIPNSETEIKYTTIEAFPLNKKITDELNYTSELNSITDLKSTFHLMHAGEWDKEIKLSEKFIFKKN